MVDTNIVIDLIEADTRWRDWSIEQLLDARRAGVVAISAIVIGELSLQSMSHEELCGLAAGFGLVIQDFGSVAAHRAGQAYAAYREAGGPREHLLGDFLVGAHAATAQARLLTRDARRYRHYFPELSLITPEIDHG